MLTGNTNTAPFCFTFSNDITRSDSEPGNAAETARGGAADAGRCTPSCCCCCSSCCCCSASCCTGTFTPGGERRHCLRCRRLCRHRCSLLYLLWQRRGRYRSLRLLDTVRRRWCLHPQLVRAPQVLLRSAKCSTPSQSYARPRPAGWLTVTRGDCWIAAKGEGTVTSAQAAL